MHEARSYTCIFLKGFVKLIDPVWDWPAVTLNHLHLSRVVEVALVSKATTNVHF